MIESGGLSDRRRISVAASNRTGRGDVFFSSRSSCLICWLLLYLHLFLLSLSPPPVEVRTRHFSSRKTVTWKLSSSILRSPFVQAILSLSALLLFPPSDAARSAASQPVPMTLYSVSSRVPMKGSPWSMAESWRSRRCDIGDTSPRICGAVDITFYSCKTRRMKQRKTREREKKKQQKQTQI